MDKARITLEFAVELRHDCQSYVANTLNVEQEAPAYHIVS